MLIQRRRASFPEIVLALLGAMLLSACGGGDGGGNASPVLAPRVDGILHGTIERGGQTYGLEAVFGAGNLMAYDEGGRFYAGTYQIPGAFETDHFVSVFEVNPDHGDSFDHVGYVVASYELTDLVITASGVTGNLDTGEAVFVPPSTAPTPILHPFELSYDRTLDEQDSATSLLAGTWQFTNASYVTTTTIADDGASSSTSTYNGLAFDCTSAGSAAIIDPAHGLYAWETTASGSACGSSLAPYGGYGFLSEGAAPRDTLTVLLENGSQFAVYTFTRQ